MFETDIPWVRYRGPNYVIKVLTGTEALDPLDDNVDVEVQFDDGKRYSATFFTLENIKRLMEDRAQNRLPWGKNGLYFWCPDLIIVRELTLDTIWETVEDVIKEGGLEEVFQSLSDDPTEETDEE